MWGKKLQLSLIISMGGIASLRAAPWSFDSASPEIKDYVVQSITGCIKTASIALMHAPTDDLREEDRPMPWYFDHEFKLSARRCVAMLRGDTSVADYGVCYLYDTPRRSFELPQLEVVFTQGPQAGKFWYFKNRLQIWGEGRELWRWHPPYDPFNTYELEEFVMLMFLTPEHTIDMKRLKPNAHPWGNRTIVYQAGSDVKNRTSEELMQKLGLEHVFSNRVFRVNEGCAFQVDYPVPEQDWRNMHETREEHLAKVRGYQNGCQAIMHLTVDEAAEIVCLAYKVNEDEAGYNIACKQYPKILKQVKELRTAFGRRLHSSLLNGGLLRE